MNRTVAMALGKANTKLNKVANNILAPYDITYTQFKVIRFLFRNPPFSVRQVDIEEHFALTNPSVTGILKNLECKGLVERKVNPDDERSKIIGLTQKTYGMQDTLSLVRKQLEELVTSVLSPDEQKQLIELLGRIADL